MSEGFRSAWCPVEYVDGPVMLALKAANSGSRGGVMFSDLSERRLLEVAQAGPVAQEDVLPLLIAGALKGLLNARGRARLLELLAQEEASRKSAEEAARFKAKFGISEAEALAFTNRGVA